MNPVSLSSFQTFGDVAAEDDAVLDYFLSTNAVDKIVQNRAFFVLGRKGTGKTAIVRYFTEGSSNSLSKALNLRGYPWSIHASRIDRGASDIEAYVSSWRYLIAVELSSLVLSHPRSSWCDSSKMLRQFLTDNYGGTEPALSDILRPQRLKVSKYSFLPAIMGNQIGGVDLDREKKDHQLGLELNALTGSIMNAVIKIAQESGSGPLRLHFDELDQGLAKLDQSRTKMLVGLILAAREIRRDSEQSGSSINPIVYLRTDIWEELQFSDKNKISQTLAFHLSWTSKNLQDLIEARLRSKLQENASWENVADPDLMRGSQTKWNHVMARTFLRPRDVISFLNSTLSETKKRNEDPNIIINKDIVNSREEYSSYLKRELDDEIQPHWQQWAEALQTCSALSTINFERERFVTEYQARRSGNNYVTAEEALRLLYRFSVIGYERRSGYGGSGWAFQYTDPEAGWDNSANRFKVHLGLKEYAKLRESRQ